MKEVFRDDEEDSDDDEEDSDDDEEDSEDNEGNSNIEIILNLSNLVVLVNCEEELFPGKVLTKDDEGETITCMQISG